MKEPLGGPLGIMLHQRLDQGRLPNASQRCAGTARYETQKLCLGDPEPPR